MDGYTFKFKDDGIILNDDPSTPTDPFVDINRVQGLNSPPFRVTERDREGQDGGFVDAEFEKMRTLVLEGFVYCPSDTLESYLDQLKSNYAPTRQTYPLYFQVPGVGERVIFCKSYGVQYDWDELRRVGSSAIQFQLIAEDPSIYDSMPVTGSTPLATPTSGRSYNKAYNYGYGAPVTGGIIILSNGGNKRTGAIITIYGPIVNPTIVHDVTGRQLSFNISLTSDQYLIVDLRTRTVLLNSTASRRSTLINTSRWFLLEPGLNAFRLLGADPISGSPDPAMTIVARGAYR